MPKATLRFYEELNDFLPRHRRKTDFEVEIKGKRSKFDCPAPQLPATSRGGATSNAHGVLPFKSAQIESLYLAGPGTDIK